MSATAEHTATPWKIHGVTEQGNINIVSNGEYIASVHSLSEDGASMTQAANARLIAAAPELLKSCIEMEDLLSEIEARLDDGEAVDQNLTIEELRAAWTTAQSIINKVIC